MLLEFSVGNYLSFQEDVTLSMVATPLKAQDATIDEGAIASPEGPCDRVLRSAVVYGANASGKSNLVSAMNLMRSFVVNSARQGQVGDEISVTPFLFDEHSADKPSYFEMAFLLGTVQYRYGFELTRDAVVSEWLYRKRTKETLLFSRDGKQFSALRAEFRDAERITRNTRKNALFLSVCAQLDLSLAVELVGWFSSCFGIVHGVADDTLGFTAHCLRDKRFDGEVLALLQHLDLGISGFNVEEREIDFDQMGVPTPLRDSLRGKKFMHVETVHTVYDDDGEVFGDARLSLASESEGTQKLFALAGPIVDTLRKGSLIVIDEFDARMHPLISKHIIKMFHDPELNPLNAQLIVVTHDTNLLSKELFRRDQIWFTEKSLRGASTLYSLASFNVRNDASYEKDYFRGRYGAVPFLGGLQRVVTTATS